MFETYYDENVVVEENTQYAFTGNDVNRTREHDWFASHERFNYNAVQLARVT